MCSQGSFSLSRFSVTVPTHFHYPFIVVQLNIEMEAKLKSEILNYKKALSKSLKELQHEHVNDILVAMAPLTLTSDLIQSTRIGHLVAEIKKNYSTQNSDITNAIVENTKVLLVQWKRIVESSAKPTKSASSSHTIDTSADVESLGEQRQKV